MIPTKETIAGESPASHGTSRPKPDSARLRSDAVSLDVPVQVHGSRVVEVIRGTTPHTEPFEEKTSTMIIFPLGGVLKMITQVSVGQAIVLTNLKTHQDAICRVVKIRTNPNLHSYVEVEFTHPQPGYWGVRFPSDGPEPPKKAAPPAASAPVAPAPVAPAAASTIPAPARKIETPKVEAPKVEVKPPAAIPAPPRKAEAPAEAPKSASPSALSIKAVETPSSEEAGELASFSLEHLRGDAGSALAISAPTAEHAGGTEVVSGIDSPAAGEAATPASSSSATAAARPAFGAGLEYSPLGSAEKDQSQGKNWLLVAACVAVLLVAAGGARFYLLHKRPATQFAVAAPPAASQPSAIAADNAPNPAQAAPSPLPAQQTGTAATPEALAPAGAPSVASPFEPRERPAESASPVSSVESRERSAEPKQLSKPAPSEPAIPSSTPVKASQSARQKPAPAMPDMFGALNAHPTTAVPSDVRAGGAAPAIDAGAIPAGQNITIASSAPSPANLAPPPPPVQPAPEGPVRVGGDVKPPRLISSPALVYPDIARQAGIEGNVVVEIVIDKSGNVSQAHAISGPVLLRDAAVNAMRERKYAPSKLDGHPISVEMLVTIQFRR